MIRYKTVDIPNLIEIQEKVLEVISSTDITSTNLFYLKDLSFELLKIKPLKNLIDEHSLMDHICDYIALNVTAPHNEIPIHIDTGKFVYSFNIPITSCKNTYVNLYDSKIESKLKQLPNGVYYQGYDTDDCELVEQVEVTTPYFLNTNLPHNIVNNSDDTRIMLLIRLDNKFGLGSRI